MGKHNSGNETVLRTHGGYWIVIFSMADEQAAMSITLIGIVKEFNLKMDWKIYKSKLTQYFMANRIVDSVVKRSILF